MVFRWDMKNIFRTVVCTCLLSLFCGAVHCAREEKVHKVEVHVSFYCYRVNGSRPPEILLLKRGNNRQIAPGKWECGGGQVRDNESFETAVNRQLYEETGLRASHWRPVDCYEIKLSDGTVLPGLSFSCRAQPDYDVKIDPREHTEYKWATLDDLSDIDFVSPKMKQIIARLLIAQGRTW
ncbi:MAG: NUDIX domain-containing protein [Puniceicoccales bacterium]|jgi:8-oxo-dGTP diphosphatase|nr:NUDIX domain-containing protein [Puniceicoccales bacterium]